MQLFSLIWNKPTWRRSWRTVPGAQLCWHRCLRFPRWSWSPSLLLRFHLPHSSQRPPQTRAPPRSRRPPTPPRPRARPPRRAAMQTNPAQMGSHVQTMRRTPRRARLTFIVLSVKSQSTLSLSWKHITAVLSRKELAFESLSVFDLNHYKPATSPLSPPGTKHKLMLEGHSVLPRRRGKVVATRAGCKSKRLGSKGSVGVPSKNFQCEVCEIFVNSETQLSQVRRHWYFCWIAFIRSLYSQLLLLTIQPC